MGLADLHIHTIHSWDATSSVGAVLKYAAQFCKLDVISITDHDRIEGALEAMNLAQAYGIEVIPGIEVSTAEGHLLTLFVNQPIQAGLSIEKTVYLAMKQGGFCIVPHPMMHSRMSINPFAIRRVLLNPELSDGIVGVEVFNAGMAGAQRDRAALAEVNKLRVAHVGCSDAHVDWMIGMGSTGFPGKTGADLRQALLDRQTYVVDRRQMHYGDFLVRFVPRLALRHAGWVMLNTSPEEPIRLGRHTRVRSSTV